MDRVAATAYLTQQYRELATEAKFSDEQTSAAYSNATDMALCYLGVAESDLATVDVAQANTLKYIALLDYFALERFSTLLSIRYDVSLPGPVSAKRSQEFSQVTTLLARAENKLATLGIVIGSTSPDFELGKINLDFLTPSHHFFGEF